MKIAELFRSLFLWQFIKDYYDEITMQRRLIDAVYKGMMQKYEAEMREEEEYIKKLGI